MAKDPAFLLYYQDFLVGTDELTNEEVGAYIRCLCIQAAKGSISEKHMKNICATHEVHNIIKSKFIFYPEEECFRNERLSLEIEKRKNYSKSRSTNRLGKKKDKNISVSYVPHMEDENTNVFNKESLSPKMVQIFKSHYQFYPVDEPVDFPSCLQIAYKIAKQKNWTKESVLNVNLNATLEAWEKIVNFSISDKWYATRSISDFNKEFQRLVQGMVQGNKKQAAPEKENYHPTAPSLTVLR